MESPTTASSRRFAAGVALLALIAASLLIALSPTNAAAAVSCPVPTAGTPGISLTKSQPAQALYNTPIKVTLTASQPASPPGAPESGFNLSFRDVLAPGVSYVGGSSPVAPQQIADQPAPGYTTLIFSNVADLAPSSDYALSYSIQYSSVDFDAGDSVTTGIAAAPAAAGAYVNCDPRRVPRFAGTGFPTGTPANSYSSEATTAPKSTLLTAIEIKKSEPSPESELLRGVHDNKTVYTLSIKNNTVNPTDGLTVVDYLPVGLEFLGCGDVDNTTDSPSNPGSPFEYPGSGSIADGPTPALPDGCPAADSVEFGTFDPDGAGPEGAGFYTQVTWNLGPAGDLGPSGEFKFNYVAAIPICPNTPTWTGSTPTPSSLGQTANLDNNSCAGGETIDEAALTNYASATGTYQGNDGPVTVSDHTSHTVTAEDLAIWKEAVPDTYEVGEVNRWKLHVRTSEYRTFDNVAVYDVAPNGTCPIVGISPPATPSGDAECANSGNSADNPIPNWASTSENPDGTWNIDWSLGSLARNEDTILEFSTRTREFYQSAFSDAGPVLSGDTLENNVDILGDAYPICSDTGGVIPCSGPNPPYIEHTQTPGSTVLADHSAAVVNAHAPLLQKQVASPASLPEPVDCSTGAGATYSDGPGTPYRPGDVVCWKLRIDFESGISTGGITITDFLPRGTSYVSGIPGTGPTANNDVALDPIVDNDTYVAFPLSAPDDTVNPTGHVFEYILATTIDNQTDDPTEQFPPLRGNLLKLSTANSAGQVTTYRDQADFGTASPSVGIAKGVTAVNGNTSVSGKPDNVVVNGGDVASYAVDVSNTGTVDAVDSTVEEWIPSPYTCSTLSNYANPGVAASASCTNIVAGGARIRWTGVDVDAGTSSTLTFDFTVPDYSSPFTQIPDYACVTEYSNKTNRAAPNDHFTYYPDNSEIDGCTPPPTDPTGPAIYDDSKVTGGGSFVKTQTTSVGETNNDFANQATIGETITYKVSFTLPQHMTVTNMTIDDPVPSGLLLDFTSPAGTLDGGPLPGGMSAGTNFGTPTLTIGSYTNTTNSPQVFALTFSAQVPDTASFKTGDTRDNTAHRSFTDQFGVAHNNVDSNTKTVTIVEPNPTLAKNEDDADDIVSPGQEIQYTLTVSNPNRASGPPSSPMHESSVRDTVPAGLTPTNGAGVPIANGADVRLCDGSTPSGVQGLWNSGTHQILWIIGDVAPASITTLRYCTEVDSSPAPAGGQILTNSATLQATAYPGFLPGDRIYNVTKTDSVTVAGTSTTKTVSDATPTIGQTITYTVTVGLPANTQFYNFKVLDDMPAGFANIQFGSVTCTVGCPPNPPTPGTVIAAGDVLTWDFGSIPAHTAARTLELTYTARVDDVVGNQQGTPLTNSAGPTWCTVGTFPCPPANTVTPTPATRTVTLTEPNLTIDKDVNCQTGDADACNVQPGSSFTYTVTIDNTGNETAYDSIVQDTAPPGLTNVVVGPLPAGVSAVAPSAGYGFAWKIDQLAPADAPIVITYTADLAPSSNFNNLDTVVNTARVTQYWGLNLADRTGNPDARTYPEGTPPADTVTLTVHLPGTQVVKTVANSGNAEINQPLQWTLTISNTDSVASLNDIDVTDVLPSGWNYVAGSTERNAVAFTDPAGTPAATGPNLKWTNVGDIAGGGSPIVLTFDATPTMSALVSGEADNPYTNNVSIVGKDASGATGHGSSPVVPYADSDSAEANIQLPLLTIEKTPDDGTAIAGTWNDFTIEVENTGPGTARDVAIADTVPSGMTYDLGTHPATAVCSPSPCDNFALDSSSATAINWTLDSLAPSAKITITVPMFVPANTADGATFTNTASTHSTERPTDVTDTGDITVETEADLGIVKDGTPNPGTAGENIVYTLTVTNNGPSDASGVQVSDDIDLSQFNFVSVVPVDNGDSCTTSGSPIDHVECDAAGILEPGDTRAYTLTLKVKSGLVDPVTNTATVDGDQDDPDPSNNTSTKTIPLGTTADLSIEKDVSTGEPSTILNHDETEFTIKVTNNGPSDALTVHVVDDLPDGLSCVSASNAGVGCPGAAGDTVTWDLGTIAAGDSVTLTITVRGEEVGDDWVNTATVSSPTDPSDSSDDATVTVNPMADLAITKSGPTAVVSGADYDYTLHVVNNGPDDAVTPEVTDTLPAGIAYVSHSTSAGSCTITGQLFSCDLPTLATGEFVDITLTVNAGFDYSEASVTNTAHVESPVTPDTIPNNNTDDAVVDVGPNADLAIVKTGPAFGAEGYALTYTLSVINNGPATAVAAEVEDVLPAGLTFQSATTNVGTCAQASGTVTCQLGDMDPGDTAQIVITTIPQASLIGTTIHNTATVSSPTPDPVLPNNTSSVNTPIENNAYPTSSNVTLTKTPSNADPKVGDTITYKLTASNSGPDTARSVVITDTLPSGLIYVSAGGGDATSCTFTAPVVNCQMGDIANGASKSTTVTVIVAKAGDIVNSATIISPNNRNPQTSVTSPISAGKSTAKLSLTKVASKKSVKVGQTVKYTIKLKNISKTTAVNVEVCDLIPARLSVVKTAGGKLKSGNLCWTVQSLAPGKSKAYKPTFRVANGSAGSVTNPVRATAGNAKTVRAKARVAVPRRSSRGGGTTG